MLKPGLIALYDKEMNRVNVIQLLISANETDAPQQII